MKQSNVFIAAGIGITPFRSMLNDLMETRKKIPLTLFYSASKSDEFVFKSFLEEAEKQLPIRIVYILSKPPEHWTGEKGKLTQSVVKKYIKDLSQITFYISGPQQFVLACQEMLLASGVDSENIKVDLFTGYEEAF